MLRNSVQTKAHDKPTKKKQLIITPRDEEILFAIMQYRGLTVDQVTRLFFKPGSLTYVRVKLMELTEHKYLSRFHLPTVSTGASPFVYTLGSRGVRFFSGNGIDLNGFKPLQAPNYYFLNHLLSLNDFLISASLLPRFTADVKLTDSLHEWRLKQMPMTTTIANEEIAVVPDGWLDFTVLAGSAKKPYRMPIWVEMDMGTEWGKKFKDKLRDIVLLVTTGAYQDRFGVQHVTVAFATPGTEKRRDLMRSHIKSMLIELGKLAYAELFLFASMPELTDPNHLFLSPIWFTSVGDTPLALLDMSD